MHESEEKEREKEVWRHEREKEVPGMSGESQNFQLRVVLLGRAYQNVNNVIWKLKTSINEFFKYSVQIP